MAKIASIFIDGEILPEAYIWPDEQATSLYRVRKQVEAAGEFDEILLNIFSPGGYCLEGWAIVDYLLSLGKPINTLAYGQCASFGTIFHTMGATREVSQHCDYVIHRPWDFFMGNDLQIEADLVALKKETTKLFEHYAGPTGKTVDELAALIQAPDLKLTPQETVDHGFSTAVYMPSASARASISSLDARKKKPSYLLSLKDRKVNPDAPKDSQSTQNTMSKIRQSLLDAANSLKAFMNGTEPKNLDNKLKDGRTLVTDSTGDVPVIGDAATIDGTTAPDADYTLENDKVVTVKDGKVSDVKDPATTDEGDGTSDSVADDDTPPPTTVAALQKENKDLKDKHKALDGKFKALESKYNELESRTNMVLGAMTSQDPPTQANNQPKGTEEKLLSEREKMLKAHVDSFKPQTPPATS